MRDGFLRDGDQLTGHDDLDVNEPGEVGGRRGARKQPSDRVQIDPPVQSDSFEESLGDPCRCHLHVAGAGHEKRHRS
ncbi:hypothetical protein ACVWYO_002777 [Sphingomonas sp. UYP23]